MTYFLCVCVCVCLCVCVCVFKQHEIRYWHNTSVITPSGPFITGLNTGKQVCVRVMCVCVWCVCACVLAIIVKDYFVAIILLRKTKLVWSDSEHHIEDLLKFILPSGSSPIISIPTCVIPQPGSFHADVVVLAIQITKNTNHWEIRKTSPSRTLGHSRKHARFLCQNRSAYY